MRLPRSTFLILGLVTAVARAQTTPPDGGGVTVLEKFIVTESAAYRAGDVLPTSRPVDSVFGSGQSVLELPRSVTVLTPELMRRFDLQGLAVRNDQHDRFRGADDATDRVDEELMDDARGIGLDVDPSQLILCRDAPLLKFGDLALSVG